MSDFAKDVSAWVNKTKNKEREFIQELAFDIAENIVSLTPVLTGFARASWYAGLSLSSPHPEQPPDRESLVLSGTVLPPPYASMLLFVKNMEVGRVLYIMNNASYIKDLEDGSSQKAPQGMVKVTMGNVDQLANKALARVLAKHGGV